MQTLQRGSALAEVIAYHEETKHHLERYARSLGYLKWEDQPNPFREYPGAPHIELPLTDQDESPSFSELFSSRSRPAQALTRRTLGLFFQFSLALSAWKETPSSRWSLRINPSSGNLHPTEAYALLPPVEEIGSSCGAYHYLSLDHSLQLRSRWEGTPTGGFYLAFTSDSMAGSLEIRRAGVSLLPARSGSRSGRDQFFRCDARLESPVTDGSCGIPGLAARTQSARSSTRT